MKGVNTGEVEGAVIYHYYYFGDQAKTGENSKNVALHYFRTRIPALSSAISGGGVLASEQAPEASASLPEMDRRQGRPGRPAHRHLVRIRRRRRRGLQCRPRAARRAAGPGGRSLEAQQQEGHRADDRRRPALGPVARHCKFQMAFFSMPSARSAMRTLVPSTQPTSLAPPAAAGCARPRSAPPCRSPCVCSSRSGLAAVAVPLGFIVWVAVETGWATVVALVFRPRVGELLVNTALLEAADRCRSATLSRGARLADRAHRPAGRAPLGLAGRGAARDSGLRPQLCLGQRRARLSRPAGRRCWSPCSPICRSSTCRSRAAAAARSRARGGRGLARPAAGASSCTSCCRSSGSRFSAARCSSACTCSPNSASIAHDPLRHLHDRDRRSVPVGLQRPRGQHAGGRAGALLLRASRARSAGCAAASAMPASARAPRGRRAGAGWAADAAGLACCRRGPRSGARRAARHAGPLAAAGGAGVWRAARSCAGARPDRLAGACRRLAHHACCAADGLARDPRARAAAAALEAAHYYVGSLPGVIVALALVTDHRAAWRCRSTRPMRRCCSPMC